MSVPQDHGAAERIMSMKNSNDTIGNRTRDLPTCSAVPQPTALPRELKYVGYVILRETFIRVLHISALNSDVR